MPASHVYTTAALAKLALHYADQSALVKIFEFQSRHLSDKLVLDCVLAVILWPDKASHLNPSSPGGQQGGREAWELEVSQDKPGLV